MPYKNLTPSKPLSRWLRLLGLLVVASLCCPAGTTQAMQSAVAVGGPDAAPAQAVVDEDITPKDVEQADPDLLVLDARDAAEEKELETPRLVPRSTVLIGSLTVFLLAVFVGFEVITKVPPTLHTPLMSGSNAISGITIVGAILTAGHALGGLGSLLGMLAVILAMINVVGGFLVTHRMLKMFKKR